MSYNNINENAEQSSPSLFALPDNYSDLIVYASLVTVETSTNLDHLKKYLTDNESIGSFFFVENEKFLFLVLKNLSDKSNVIEYLNKYEEAKFEYKQVPCSNFNSVLVAQLNDQQLHRLDKDKNTALKLIQSKTGLKLKKQKKLFYFNGNLFQFGLLDRLFAELEFVNDQAISSDSVTKADANPTTVEMTKQTFELCYDLNAVIYYRRIVDMNFEILKSTLNISNIYVTKCNNSMDAILHYTMQDTNARNDSNDKIKFKLNEVSKYLVEVKIEFENKKRDYTSAGEIFNEELCLKHKLVYLFNAGQQQIRLLGFNDDLKAFCKLHQAYVRLLEHRSTDATHVWMVNMHGTHVNSISTMSTVDFFSNDTNWKANSTKGVRYGVGKIDLFSYDGNVFAQNTDVVVCPFGLNETHGITTDCAESNEMYTSLINHFKSLKSMKNVHHEGEVECIKPCTGSSKTVLYACVPLWLQYGNKRLSEFERLLRISYQNILLEADKNGSKTLAMSILSYAIDEYVSIDSCLKCLHDVLNQISLKTLNSICLISQHETTRQNIASCFQSHTQSQTTVNPKLSSPNLKITVSNRNNRLIVENPEEPLVRCCLFCQTEDATKLIPCLNPTCSTSFCKKCLVVYEKNQQKKKCPNCKWSFDDLLSEGKSPVELITNGRLAISTLNESCDGYNRSYALKVTLTVKDKPQIGNTTSVLHYAGITKFVYLPDTVETKEVVRLLEQSIKNGSLFQIAYDSQKNERKVCLNPAITFKTQLHGGGRYGYPDSGYLANLIRTLKQLQ